jgi:nickel/cobalt transporter (NicO) family protein
MNELHTIRSRTLRPTLLLGLIALLIGLLAPPQAALAHPLDVYLQASYITVAPAEIGIELDLSPGVLVVPQMLPQLDTDRNQQVSEAEGQAYVDTVLRNVVLQVDGKPMTLAVTTITMPDYLTFQSGYGMIRIFTTVSLPDGLTGTHQIAYTNTFTPTGSAYQVNTFVEKGAALTLGKQNRDSIQQSLTVDYTIGGAVPATGVLATPAAAATTAATIGTAAGASGQAQQLLAYLYAPALSPWMLLLALALAVVLGGLHALTPGHGKTLVAAYLVGSRGTVRHAIALGAIVTFTHTASVIVIGLLALFASQFIVPGVLVPIMTILSGLLVVVLGVRLVWQRWVAFHSRRSPDHGHNHDHSHDNDHSHDHDSDHTHALSHDHGDGHAHAHVPPAEGITVSSLVAMGVSGGLIPCPEALGIMVIAIGLNRILLGLGLLVSFSFGLAAVLIAIGIVLVRSRSLIERFGGIGSRWSRALPLASAVTVTVLGIGITLSGLATYLG